MCKVIIKSDWILLLTLEKKVAHFLILYSCKLTFVLGNNNWTLLWLLRADGEDGRSHACFYTFEKGEYCGFGDEGTIAEENFWTVFKALWKEKKGGMNIQTLPNSFLHFKYLVW